MERLWSSKGTDNVVQRMPAGPTVVVAPWNTPVVAVDLEDHPRPGPGNTVVLKPAEWAPLSASILADLADESGIPRVPQHRPGDRGSGRCCVGQRPPGATDQLHRIAGDGTAHR